LRERRQSGAGSVEAMVNAFSCQARPPVRGLTVNSSLLLPASL
jgi:hypothetical protein